MKKTPYIVGLAVGFLAMCMPEVGFNQAPPQQPPPQPIPDQYIVILKESVAQPVIKQARASNERKQRFQAGQQFRNRNVAKLKEVHGKRGLQESAVQHYYADALVGFSGKMSKTQADALRSDPDVAGVYQDMTIVLPPLILEPVKLISTQTTSCAVQMAGGPIDGSGKATWIWILDTGINLTHPDLNVITDPTWAVSFIAGQTVEDGKGHGTHVAGIAAAKNNTFGVVGVSAGARVVPVKVLDNNGNGSTATILAGLNHVAAHDIPGDVVNMSLSAYPINPCTTSYPAITAAVINLGLAGTSVAIAAGNNNNCNGALSALPGCINGTKVYTVGAINCDKTCAGGTATGYSNFAANVVDWVAVGTSVYSTYKAGGYATLTGTSMATPVVAGIIHALNGGSPVSAGTVTCCGASYRIAKR
jgi:hypothetical protein